MKLNKQAQCIIYRLRKQGVIIDTNNRVIFYEYLNPEQEAKMQSGPIIRLCKEFGFGRQSLIPCETMHINADTQMSNSTKKVLSQIIKKAYYTK